MTKSRGILAARRLWTIAELELLRLHYADTPTALMAQALGRKAAQVYSKARKIGLAKSDAFMAGDKSGRVQRGKQDPRMQAHQFKPAQVPWNKGLHYQPGGRVAETQFKAGMLSGRAAQLVQPLGSYRVNGDGYVDRKISNKSGPQHHRWKPVHRMVWEAANGRVPAGHVVVFRPARHTTDPERITLDALELVTRGELMRRNSLHTQYPPEVARLVQLRGALTRQINRKAKEQAE